MEGWSLPELMKICVMQNKECMSILRKKIFQKFSAALLIIGRKGRKRKRERRKGKRRKNGERGMDG